jgi:hemerythrin superfamily protein
MINEVDNVDALSFLEDQHREIRSLFAVVADASSADRADAFQCLVRLLAVHETAEEEVLHPAVRRIDGGEAVVKRRLAEESMAKQALADLEKMGVADSGFDQAFGQFRRLVQDHAGREAHEEFPLARSGSDEAARQAMGRQLHLAEAIAPTHPHPHGPESAVGNLLVGPFVAIADRVRDALHKS